jgi:hypothetical protein
LARLAKPLAPTKQAVAAKRKRKRAWISLPSVVKP